MTQSARQKYKPAVDLKWLILLSGMLWSIVGVTLLWRALGWLQGMGWLASLLSVVIGLVLGSAISGFGFVRLARRNRDRILEYQGRACFFAFQRWQSYLLILVMIALGIFLRTSHLLPLQVLIVIYLGFGIALAGSSIVYYRAWFQTRSRSIPADTDAG